MEYLSQRRSQAKAMLMVGFFVIAASGINMNAQEPIDGTMNFTVRTVTAGGNFSPKHVLAIWIEDSEGFVKTRKVRADKRMEYLYTWNTKTGSNVVDAISGSTLSSHQTHSVEWDCRDVDGNLVPDGTYTVYVEFTDQHSQGPMQMVSFAKGADSISLSPADEANFKDMALSFTPVTAPVSNRVSPHEDFRIFPNPSHGMFTMQWKGQVTEGSVEVYDMRGTLMYAEQIRSSGQHFVDISNLPTGLYLLKVTSENQLSEQIIVKE